MSRSGLITQNELQQFADRPAGFCWALHRGSNDHVAGCEDVQGVESGSGFSVVLHELKVNDAPRAGGVFSWKKVKKAVVSYIEQVAHIVVVDVAAGATFRASSWTS